MSNNSDRRFNMSWVFVCILLIIVFLGFTYNSLVQVEENVNLAKSNVEEAMQSRIEKLPDLVATVQNYTNHEAQVYSELADSREALAASISSGDLKAMEKADNELTAKINSMIALAEDNPEFQAAELHSRLMDQIEGAVNRIHQARREYNAAVNEYNRKIRQFPCNIYATLFGFEPMEEFTAVDEAHETSVVDFSK